MSLPAGGARTFDLAEASRMQARWLLPNRLVVGGIGILAVIFGGIFLRTDANPGIDPATDQFLLWGMLIAGLLGIVGAANLRNGPTAARIDLSGVRFGWPSGRTDVYLWSAPTLRIVLVDFRGARRTLKDPTAGFPLAGVRIGLVWKISRWSSREYELTPSAFDAILAVGKDRGLKAVEEVRPIDGLWNARRVTLTPSGSA